MPTPPLPAVEAALARGGVKAALQTLETAGQPAAPGTALRKWLIHSAAIDASIVDSVMEKLKAEDVFEVADVQVLRISIRS